MNTIELLDALRAKYPQLTSDRKAAAFLGINQQNASRWRTKGIVMEDETAVKFADALGIDTGIVLMWINAERSKCPAAKAALQKAAERLSHVAAALILGVSLLLPTPPASAGYAPDQFNRLCIIRNTLRLLLVRLRRLPRSLKCKGFRPLQVGYVLE